MFSDNSTQINAFGFGRRLDTDERDDEWYEADRTIRNSMIVAML